MPRILIVDDEPHIVRGLEDNLRFEGYETTASLDGEDGLRRATSEAPDLILLDWNLPKKNGREVLAEVKDDAHLKTIPIVVLTTSQAERDILTAYGQHANCYITKPVNFQNFTQVIREIGNFWLTVVALPPG